MERTGGPDADAIIRHITETFPETIVARTDGGTFFSLSEKNWPNFATLITTDDFDQVSELSRPGVFRLNIGVKRETFQRLLGDVDDPDFTAFDRLLPHPTYAKQNWLSILNPGARTFEEIVKPLLVEAHGKLAERQERGGDHG